MPTAADASPGAATGAASAPRPDRGRVVAARGSVLDVEFLGHLPAIREALAVEWDVGAPLIAEVQQHLEPRRVRAVALQGTGGLKRGTAV
ncbi:MAG: F0F1 ATP synthase subunit beta, partial [Gammaproteobacteria bacterium]|nr:F0F1 ATP synthase subunit beta [Gammaproteobacteria bacterium]